MATKRKAISKKTRFEVFKRDKFTCQYCGQSAPDVILNADHIVPASKGGDNDIMNLVTSCKDCNAGKSDRELSDDSVIKKQKQALDELAERREQLKAMLQWKEELRGQGDLSFELAEKEITKHLPNGRVLNDLAKKKLRTWIREFGISLILDCIDISFDKYNGFEECFNKIPRIAFFKNKEKNAPYPEFYKDLNTLCKIAECDYTTYKRYQVAPLIESLLRSGYSFDDIKNCMNKTNHYYDLLKNLNPADA